MQKQKHLNLEARILIETSLNQHLSFKSIAKELGKDCTTISKEIKSHISFDKTGTFGRPFQDCRLAILRQCSARNVCHSCVSPSRKFCWSCGKYTSSCTTSDLCIAVCKW